AATIAKVGVGAMIEEPVEESGPAPGGGDVYGRHEVIRHVDVFRVFFEKRDHAGLIVCLRAGDHEKLGWPGVRVVSGLFTGVTAFVLEDDLRDLVIPALLGDDEWRGGVSMRPDAAGRIGAVLEKGAHGVRR